MTKPRFSVGQRVRKRSGYSMPGVVVAVYATLNGQTRYVVECTAWAMRGCQHIFNEEQLVERKPVISWWT
jgi:hypothetical protein